MTQYFSHKREKPEEWLSNINIEEVYSFLHSFERVFSSRSYRRSDFEVARSQLHKYIIAVIRYVPYHVKKSTFMKRLILSLGSEDSIITFNWDTLVDRALEEAGTPVATALLSSLLVAANPNRDMRMENNEVKTEFMHSGKLIKIHGAVNLTHCQNSSCYRHENPYVWSYSEEGPAYWSCDNCGSPTQEMILSPHGAKTYTTNRFFRLQANWAAECLTLASRIVIIGYSFPVFDIEARSMLRCSRLSDRDSEAWLSEVCIVDPSVVKDDHVRVMADLIGINNHYAHGHEVGLRLFNNIEDFMAYNY